MTHATATPLEWQALWDAMDAAPGQWIPTTETMFWAMLECMPPRAMSNGSFLVGEPQCHDENGQPVYACFVERVGGLFFARYMTPKEFNAL